MTDLSLREQIADIVVSHTGHALNGLEYSEADAADAILELLKGAVPVWQPIETAPKDGTPILTYSSGCGDREAYLVMWWTADKAERCGFGWEAYEVDHMLGPDLWMPLLPASSQRWG